MSTTRLATAARPIYLHQAPPTRWNAFVSTEDTGIPKGDVYSVHSTKSTRAGINFQPSHLEPTWLHAATIYPPGKHVSLLTCWSR